METGPTISVVGGDKIQVDGTPSVAGTFDITIYQVVLGGPDIQVDSMSSTLGASVPGSVTSKSLLPGDYRVETKAGGGFLDTQRVTIPRGPRGVPTPAHRSGS